MLTSDYWRTAVYSQASAPGIIIAHGQLYPINQLQMTAMIIVIMQGALVVILLIIILPTCLFLLMEDQHGHWLVSSKCYITI